MPMLVARYVAARGRDFGPAADKSLVWCHQVATLFKTLAPLCDGSSQRARWQGLAVEAPCLVGSRDGHAKLVCR